MPSSYIQTIRRTSSSMKPPGEAARSAKMFHSRVSAALMIFCTWFCCSWESGCSLRAERGGTCSEEGMDGDVVMIVVEGLTGVVPKPRLVYFGRSA
jgi:hypothetical protein